MIKKLLLLLLLLPIASASTVFRTISYDGISYDGENINLFGNTTEFNVTIYAFPLSDFDNPGFQVREYIPNGMSFANTTNADWYEYKDNVLTMIKLLPTGTATLSYTLKFNSSITDSMLYGTYKDENNLQYTIQSMNIFHENATINEIVTKTFINSTPSPTFAPEKPIDISIKDVAPVAQQTQKTESDNSIYLFFTLILIALTTSFYLKFKPKKSFILNEIQFSVSNERLFLEGVEFAHNFDINVQNDSERAMIVNVRVPDSVISVMHNDDILLAHTSLISSMMLKNKADYSGVITISGR